MSDIRKVEEALLGNAFSAIISETEKYMPRISEYMFQREVLDLLTSPFGPEFLNRYLAYVGELTNTLHVVSNEDPNQILFTVPAFMQRPRTGMARADGLTAEDMLRSLARMQDMGGRGITAQVQRFLSDITQVPDYRQVVINPIQDILARYGRQMTGPLGDQPTTAATHSGDLTGSSFTDEYDD